MSELVKLRWVIEQAEDMSRLEVLDHLKMLHRRHGKVLFRKAPGPRAPYWVSVEALRLHWSTRFGKSTAQAADLMALYARIDRVEAIAERALEAALGGSSGRGSRPRS